MSKIQKQNQVIDLHHFARQKRMQQLAIINRDTSSERTSPSFGLSTLMYFHNNGSLSSIRSHQMDYSHGKIESNRFIEMVGEARREIEEMKLKRLQLQSEWRQKKADMTVHKIDAQCKHSKESYLENSLNTSEVQEYSESIYKSIYPRQIISTQPHKEEDRFIIQLRNDIVKRKIQTFFTHIKRMLYIGLIEQLKQYRRLAQFKKNTELSTTMRAFRSWKEIVQQIEERSKLRELILQRIKKRRHLHSLDTQHEVYLQKI